MAEVGAQGDDRLRRPKTPAEEPDAVQFADPLVVGHIAFASGHVVEVPRVDEQKLEPSGLEDFENGDPLHAGGFHRHARHATGREPVGHAQQIGRESLEGLDRSRVSIGRDGDKMLRRATVDAGDMRIDPIQHRE
jgi:hypothetical protein